MKKAQFTLSPIFQDNMVFQANKSIRIHGVCKKGIEIKVDFLGETYKVRPKCEQFCIEIEPSDYLDEGFSFSVYTKKQEEIFYNCLIGDVFLIAGDSNAYLPIKQSLHQVDFEEDNLRLLDLSHGDSQLECSWELVGKANHEEFSALAFAIAKNIYTRVQKPLAVISCTSKDSTLFSWLSMLEIKSHMDLLKYYQEFDSKHNLHSTNSFETMISKVIPHSIKAFVFYQGENDKQLANVYDTALQRLILAYRFYFRDKDLPFIFTQIPGIKKVRSDNDELSRIRISQSSLINEEKHIFLASAVDLGDEYNERLTDKAVIAKRITNVIMDKIYKTGKSSISPSCYSYSAQHDRIRIFTQNNYMNLVSKSGKNLGFSYTTDGVNFLESDDVRLVSNQIVLRKVDGVKEIRYAYDDFPVCDIYTDNDLPLLPFSLKIY